MNEPQVASDPSGAAHREASDADPELETYFQPFYNLSSGALQGLEALIRRHNTESGHTEAPGDFFADAEASGRMRDIDLRMLDEAVTHMERWQGEGRTGLILSVNLSRATIGRPEFADDVLETLDRHGVPGHRLLLDITTATFRDLAGGGDEALSSLRRLQTREITFCLDGFTPEDIDVLDAAAATPVDIIKLDPTLLNAGTDTQLADVTTAIHNAGLPVVAAGIETAEQLALVRSLEIEWAQGFHLGAPTDAENALAYPEALPQG